MIRFAGVEARPGDVVLLRGPNGSGKTSLLRALAGLEAPIDVGRVEPDLRGEPAAALPARVALSPQSPRDALAGLTVEGEMRMRGRGVPGDIIMLAGRDVATLSSGEARRVALEAADSGAPLLLLDEPAEGLDAAGRARVRDLVRRARGIVVAADHAGLLDDLATRVVDLAPATPAEDAPWPPAPPGPALVDGLGPGFHAVAGPNGSGKTTLLRRLARATPGARLAPPDPRATFTRDTVAEELRGAPGGGLVPDALLARHPLTLSGGEAQRVSLARALGREAKVYLLDEPEAHLDAQGRAAMLALVGRRIAEGACVLVATHDERLLARAATVRRLEGPA